MLARSNITEVPNKVFDRLYPHQGARGGHSKRADEKLEQYYSDPQLVGIVTRFYYDDCVNFRRLRRLSPRLPAEHLMSWRRVATRSLCPPNS